MNIIIKSIILAVVLACMVRSKAVDPKTKELEGCDIFSFSKDLPDISFICTKKNNNNLSCRAYCTLTGIYAKPRIYRCKSVSGRGIWKPKKLPDCKKALKRCSVQEFAKHSENMKWNCIQNSKRTKMTCKPSCQLKDEHLTNQGEYKCKVTRGEVKWQPDVPPSCQSEVTTSPTKVNTPPKITTSNPDFRPYAQHYPRGRSGESHKEVNKNNSRPYPQYYPRGRSEESDKDVSDIRCPWGLC